MTLIIALGNSEQVIQISDRRLSSNGRLVDDESGKAGQLTCRNGRFAFGATGLARYGGFSTREWLLDALLEAGSPDYEMAGILGRLTERATSEFAQNRVLRSAPSAAKRLSVMFSGYLYHRDPPLAAFAILTNFQDFESGLDQPEAWDEFRLIRWSEKRPFDGEPTLVQRVGNWQAMTGDDEMVLRGLLEARKPARAIIGKAVEVMAEIADRPAANGTIGKQLTTICIPRNLEDPIESSYFTSINRSVIVGADGAWLMADDKRLVWKDPQLEIGGKVVAVPKVGRNQPCPCGSGRKYKHCHGKH